MFIERGSFRLKTNKSKIANEHNEMDSANSLQITVSHAHPKTDVQLGRYPVFYYLIAFLLIPTFAYLIYSANGGVGGIPGFNNRQWWQYLVAIIPIIVSLLLFGLVRIEYVRVSSGKIEFSKAILLGFRTIESIEKEVGEVINVSIIKKGVQRITFTNSSYFLVFNFRSFEEIEALECGSKRTAIDYVQQLKGCFPFLRGSVRKLTLRNVVQI